MAEKAIGDDLYVALLGAVAVSIAASTVLVRLVPLSTTTEPATTA